MPTCCDCGEDVPKAGFAKSQLKKAADKRRCKRCAEPIAGAGEPSASAYHAVPGESDCPICFMKLPFEHDKIVHSSCCGKVCCQSCVVEAMKKNPSAMKACFFCKAPPAPPGRPRILRLEKRAELNDPHAITTLGFYHAIGREVPKDERKAIDYLEKGARLGHAHSMFLLGMHCRGGRGPTLVPQDYGRARRLLLGASEAGHVLARCELASMEEQLGNYGEAKRHFMLAAKAGHDVALDQLKHAYRAAGEEFIRKEELAAAMRSHSEAKKELEDERRKRNRAMMDFISSHRFAKS